MMRKELDDITLRSVPFKSVNTAATLPKKGTT